MSKMNPKIQLAQHGYPLALVFAFSYDDAAKLNQLYTHSAGYMTRWR